MPIYEFKCIDCETTHDVFRTISTRHHLPKCPSCKGSTVRIVSSPRITIFTPYRSPVDGTMIESKVGHRAHLVKHDLVETGNEEVKPLQRPKPKSTDLKAEIAKHIYK